MGGAGPFTELEHSPFGKTLVRSGAMAFSPDGAFLFSSGNGLNAFAVNGVSGALEAVDGSPFSLDVGTDFFATNLPFEPARAPTGWGKNESRTQDTSRAAP